MAELIKISDVIKICKSFYASYGTTAFFPFPVFENLLRTSAVDVDKYVPQWIAVKDRLPEPLTDVLVYQQTPRGNCAIGISWRKGNGEWMSKDICETLYWMPLPELPKENKDG